ncbi:hypothetical protein DFR58_11421 [Anaerobacterium chartisolvens]|uniref:Uncharacterized protein n=1 Tax=Anaerobacterium chartisolvens TaxID=1297424 RepID=A0A369B2Y0_9FIRM|nr:hypothetical protein DFR58_11421 [Anaerobacterium chartisolvens]
MANICGTILGNMTEAIFILSKKGMFLIFR